MIRNGVRKRGKLSSTDALSESKVSTAIDAALMGELARLISSSDLAELEVEKGDLRIRMVRYSPAPIGYAQPVPASAPLPTVAVAPTPVAVAIPILSPSDADHPGAVKSPMVGTAYRRASPESKAFVDIGSVVKAGDKVLLVEAMKTFNEIVAPKAGTVTAIFIDDGQPVEYGEPLMVIE